MTGSFSANDSGPQSFFEDPFFLLRQLSWGSISSRPRFGPSYEAITAPTFALSRANASRVAFLRYHTVTAELVSTMNKL